MELTHKHASDGLGLLATAVGAGVVDVNGLSVMPPAPSNPDLVAGVLLEAKLKPVITALEEPPTFDAKVLLIIAEVGRAPDGAAAALFVQKPRLPALLISAA